MPVCIRFFEHGIKMNFFYRLYKINFMAGTAVIVQLSFRLEKPDVRLIQLSGWRIQHVNMD